MIVNQSIVIYLFAYDVCMLYIYSHRERVESCFVSVKEKTNPSY